MVNKRWLTLALSLLGVFGVGGTAYVAVRCSKVADEKETKKEKILAYAPAVVVGVGTSAAILGSHYVSRQEIIALTATCGYLASNRDKIETKLKEKFGMEKLSEIRQEVAKEQIEESKINLNGAPWDNVEWKRGFSAEYTGRGNERFLDWESGRQFFSNYRDVREGIRKINQDFKENKSVYYNELYRYWGIQETDFGQREGWFITDDNYYDFDIEEPLPFDLVHVNIGEPDDMWIIYNHGIPPMKFWMEV